MVLGTARDGELKKVLTSLESFRSALTNLFPSARVNGPVPTTIVVLEDFDAFRRYQPKDSRGRRMGNVGGYFKSQPDANFIVFPYVGDASYELIFHEYTHYFVRQNVRTSIPLWLNEGLAEFYSTFRPDFRGQSVLGAPPEDRMRTLRENTFLPVLDLVSPKDMEKMWRSGRIDMFYAEAWALTHYLTIGRKNVVGSPIAVYLNTLAATDSQDQAFQAAFGVDVAGMDRELRDYVRRYLFQAAVIPKVVRGSEPVVEAAPEVVARQVQGTLLESNDDIPEAEREIQRALAVDPGHVDSRVTLGTLRLRQDRNAEAISILREAADAAPTVMAAQYYLGVALTREWRHVEALAAFTRATKANEANPYAWLGLSEAALALGRDAQAAATLRRALLLEANPGFHRGYARVAFGVGKNETAVASTRAYLDSVGLTDESGQYAAFIGAVAELRRGRAEEARALLLEIEAAVRPGTWTETVLRFLQEKVEADAFLAKASDVGERTEAHTYIGLRQDIAGRRDDALTHFKWVVTQGSRNYSEYAIARAEIRRLEPPTTTASP